MKKRTKWGIGYGAALGAFTLWLMLDTFVIPHVYGAVVAAPTMQAQAEETETAAETLRAETVSQRTAQSKGGKKSGKSGGSAQTTQNTQTTQTAPTGGGETAEVYDDGSTRIELTEYRYLDTTVYVADVQVESAQALSAVLAGDVYARNVTETPSDMAERSGAVLAVNGDYYGARQTGYVIRNGVLYRESGQAGQEDLVIDGSGDFSIVREDEVSARELLADGAWQVYSFGPGLIEDGEITVGMYDEVDRAMASNPRTALAQVGKGHYLFVVADGRSGESQGLTLYELAQFLKDLGAGTAYNLDGGGSSAMIFQGRLVNDPSGSGRGSGERKVSDIVGIF